MHSKVIIKSLAALSRDERVTVWHMGMYSAMLQLWYEGNFNNPVSITRRKILARSHIGNIVTYHKCIKELVLFGYIRYQPSYHPSKGSLVYLNF